MFFLSHWPRLLLLLVVLSLFSLPSRAQNGGAGKPSSQAALEDKGKPKKDGGPKQPKPKPGPREPGDDN